MSGALELREANGIACVLGFPERRTPVVLKLNTARKALQDRKAAHEESEVVIWTEHGMFYDEVIIDGVAEHCVRSANAYEHYSIAYCSVSLITHLLFSSVCTIHYAWSCRSVHVAF